MSKMPRAIPVTLADPVPAFAEDAADRPHRSLQAMLIVVEFFNHQKQAKYLCIDDYFIYDNRVVRVKDASFSGRDGMEIEAQILTSSPGWVDILVIANRTDVFTLVSVRHSNPELRG